MRIAVLTNSYPPEGRGGAARVASMQVDMLRAAGHDVRAWAPQIGWFAAPPVVRLVRHLFDLGARQDLVKEIAAWKPDALITHNVTGCGWGTADAIRRSLRRTQDDTRWVHVLHDVQLFEPSGQLKDARPITLWQTFWSAARGRAIGQPDLIISPTEWLLKEHRRRGFFVDAPAVILPNPAPVTRRGSRTAHLPVRLLFVGRLSPDKGSGIIKEIERGMRQTVEVASDLDHQTVLEKMKQADVLLMPSQIEENQPTVILEAASVGLPVVASDKDGIRETLGDAGLVVTADDAAAWCEAIRSITRDAETYRNQSEKMHEMASRHDPDRYRDTFLSFLKSNT